MGASGRTDGTALPGDHGHEQADDERRRRADFIEDVATAVWGGDAAESRVKALRGPD